MIDLLGPGPIRDVRIDLTTRCNLRCVYCAVSQPLYQGVDMPESLMGLLEGQLCDMGAVRVHLNGHGETTFMKNWDIFCTSLARAGRELYIISNLSLRYNDVQIEALAHLHHIAISIDTADPDLLKRMRRKVDLNRIVGHVPEIRRAAARIGRPEPAFSFSCGLYDRNTPGIEDLARLAITLGVEKVTFWNLVKYPDIEGADNVLSLDQLPIPDLAPRLAAIDRAIALLTGANIWAEVAGDFLAPLRKRVTTHAAEFVEPGAAAPDLRSVPAGSTRDCTDPWLYVEFDTSNNVKPCCKRPPIGSLQEDSLQAILNGTAIRSLRLGLLTGDLDGHCLQCHIRGVVPVEVFERNLAVALIVGLPPGFDEEGYLAANPDVAEARVPAVDHYLKCGQFEGRPLDP